MIDLITVAEAAKSLKISTSTVRRMCESGQLESIPIGVGKRKHYRIYRSSLTGQTKVRDAQVEVSNPIDRLSQIMNASRRLV